MSEFRMGQIWLVDFEPSVGHEYQKKRPALIVQNDDYIRDQGLLTVIPLSSKIENRSGLDVLVKKDSNNRLWQDSLVKVKQINSFDQRRFVRLIGVASSKVMDEVEQSVQDFLF